jgi:hypothetical protein
VGLLSEDRINSEYMQRNEDEQTIQWNPLTLAAVLLTNGAGFSGLRFRRDRPTTCSAVKHGTNVITNGTTSRSAVRTTGPATLCKFPHLIVQLRKLIIFWSLWSDLLVHYQVAKFGSIDMIEWNFVGIQLVNSLSSIRYPI